LPKEILMNAGRNLFVVSVVMAILTGCASSPADRFARMSDEELVDAVRQRENQVFYVWYGCINETLTKDYIGGVSPGVIAIVGSPSLQWADKTIAERLERNPYLLLESLRDDPHQHFDPLPPDRAITVIYLYNRFDRLKAVQEAKDRLAERFRPLLHSHPDVRVRYVVAEWLHRHQAIQLADWQRMLDDPNSLIRIVGSGYDPDDGSKGTDAWWLTLFGHLNDPHFWVRAQLFPELDVTLSGGRYPYLDRLPGNPPVKGEHIDWVRADWHVREETRLAWIAWYKANSQGIQEYLKALRARKAQELRNRQNPKPPQHDDGGSRP
jgi:hypothetical protein